MIINSAVNIVCKIPWSLSAFLCILEVKRQNMSDKD